MVWFFERDRRRLHYEIRHQPDGPAYELVVTYPDGSQQIERFPDVAPLVALSERLYAELVAQGWRALTPRA
jgi:hypothetical protein